MNSKIVSPKQTREFRGLTSITIPASRGQMQILPGHAESFVRLRPGTVVLENDEKREISVSSGVCHIRANQILIIL